MKELWSAHAPAWSPRMRPVRPQSGNAPARSARSRPLAAARLGPPPRTHRKTDYKYRSLRLCVSPTPTSQGDTTPRSHEAWLPLQK